MKKILLALAVLVTSASSFALDTYTIAAPEVPTSFGTEAMTVIGAIGATVVAVGCAVFVFRLVRRMIGR